MTKMKRRILLVCVLALASSAAVSSEARVLNGTQTECVSILTRYFESSNLANDPVTRQSDMIMQELNRLKTKNYEAYSIKNCYEKLGLSLEQFQELFLIMTEVQSEAREDVFR